MSYTELRKTLWTPINEKKWLRKILTVERVSFWWTDAQSTRWFSFPGVIKPSRVRRKKPDKKARSL